MHDKPRSFGCPHSKQVAGCEGRARTHMNATNAHWTIDTNPHFDRNPSGAGMADTLSNHQTSHRAGPSSGGRTTNPNDISERPPQTMNDVHDAYNDDGDDGGGDDDQNAVFHRPIDNDDEEDDDDRNDDNARNVDRVHRRGDHLETPVATSGGDSVVGDDDDMDELLFRCRCESAKTIATLLSCLRHVTVSGGLTESAAKTQQMSTQPTQRRGRTAIQPVTVFCSPASLTFHVYGTARQSQASVNLQNSLFSDYQVLKQNSSGNSRGENGETQTTTDNTEDDNWKHGGEFCVNLTSVLECMHVFGTQNLERTKLFLSYNLTAEVFKVELLEEGVVTDSLIPGMLPPDDTGNSLALAFRSTPIVARMIVKSEWLREALIELELVSGASCCTIALGPDGLELAAVGSIGECLVSLPGTNDLMVSLESTVVSARSYPLSSFLSGMRGLEYAEETCVSINEAGMIAIQHQVLDTIGEGAPSFVDFIMSCLQDDEESSGNPYTMGSSTAGGSNSTNNRRLVSQDSLGWGASQTQPLSHSYVASTVGNQTQPQSLLDATKNTARVAPPSGAAAEDEDEDEDEDGATITNVVDAMDNSQNPPRDARINNDIPDARTTKDDNNQNNDDQDDDDDNDDEDENEPALPPSSVAPLFGTVVDEAGSRLSSSASKNTYKRRRRRGPSRTPSRRASKRTGRDGDDGTRANGDEEHDNACDRADTDEDEPLDVTETVTPTRTPSGRDKEDDDGYSSPEVVYG